jgi:hypothetical protein
MVIFETFYHAPIYESVEEFNKKTLAFLQGHSSETRSQGS